MTEKTGGDYSRLVAGNALWNLLGRCAPLIVAIVATPFLLRALGVDRWGIFTLALSLVGIFGVFDFGIGRALTRLMASHIAEGREDEAARAAKTAVVLVTGLGVLAGGTLALLAPQLVNQGLRIAPALRDEAVLSLYILSLCAPLVLANAALWGILAALQKFRGQNLINIPIMSFYYLGPLALLPFWDHLAVAIGVLVVARLAMTVAYYRICVQAMPALATAKVSFAGFGPVVRQGGWITVSNIIAPGLQYFDRFAIASLVSMSATAYYSTPLDLVMRFWVVPVAITHTLFPALASTHVTSPAEATVLVRRGLIGIAAIVFPAALFLAVHGKLVLGLWLGGSFAGEAATVLQWMAVGIFFNCLAFVPAGLIDGVGKSRANAIFSAAQLVVVIPLLLLMIKLFGIQGAAIAWTGRGVVDWLGRMLIAGWAYRPSSGEIRRFLLLSLAWLAILLLGLVPLGPLWAWPWSAALLLTFFVSLWFWGLSGEDRGQALGLVRRFTGKGRPPGEAGA